MKVLMVIAPKGYRDEEFSKSAEVFEKSGVAYDVASTAAGDCEGMMGSVQNASLAVADAKEADYDALVICGGIGARDFLWTHEPLIELVKQFNAKGKVIGAICLAPVILAYARVLDSIKATVFDTPASVELLRQSGAKYVKEAVVSDKNIVTGDHPVASVKFAQEILSKLN